MPQKFEYYNEIASSYDELHGKEQIKKLELIKTELLRNNLLEKGIFVLDVGAGTGLSSLYIDIEAIKVVSLEPAFELLKRNKNRYRVQGIAEFLPFKANTFQIVQSITAMHNFDDIPKAIEEMKRAAKNRAVNNNAIHDKAAKSYFIVSLLKKSQSASKITTLLKKEFKVIKEIEEEKDLILILKRHDF
ncbi:methyltransferase domain-containing protein [Candidatus Woesearchaeota archaeon]|nr:methyltransferase domain-containing protein [Candidatus Woesearchaeota archaeon]